VASSIHELAVILGEDLATEDLVPVFSGFMKDLDEVRIGVLKHLADFLKVFSCPRGMLLCNCVTSPFPFLVPISILVRNSGSLFTFFCPAEWIQIGQVPHFEGLPQATMQYARSQNSIRRASLSVS